MVCVIRNYLYENKYNDYVLHNKAGVLYQHHASMLGEYFKPWSLIFMKIPQYSLIGQSVETANCNRALKCIVHSSLDRYSLIEQSLCSEIL